jgi:hypothetical protein
MRADCCSARGVVRVRLSSGSELLMCQHHAWINDHALTAAGAAVSPEHDDSEEKVTTSV